MSTYKSYDPDVGKKAKLKYVKEKQQRIEIAWKKTEYAERIEPAIKESGLPTATFIKQAVDEKIERFLKNKKISTSSGE